MAGLGAAAPARAQTAALPTGDPYTVRAYTVADGLPLSDVQFLEQTADGHILVASGREPPVLFDGYGFRAFDVGGFDVRTITWLHRDLSGRVWLVNGARQLAYLDAARRFHLLPPTPSRLFGITETRDGEIWLGTATGLLRLVLGTAQPYEALSPALGLPADTTAGLVELPGGERLVVTKQGLFMAHRDATGHEPRYTPLGPRVRVPRFELHDLAYVDPSGLWLGTWDGPIHYDGRTVRRFDLEDGEHPLQLGGFEWSSRGAIVPFHVARRIQPPDTTGGPLGLLREILDASDGSRILREYPDDDGPASLAREIGGRVEPLSLAGQLEFRDVGDMLEDREGSIWIATDRGLVQLAPRRISVLHRDVSLPETFTTAIRQTRDGTVWVGTWGGGLVSFADANPARRFTVANGLLSNEVRALYEDVEGTLWVGTSEGVQVIREGLSGRLSGRYARSFAETVTASGERVLAVAFDEGLRFVPIDSPRRGSITSYEPFPDVEWGRLWALQTDSSGGLLVGGTGGLFRVSGDSVRKYGRGDGLAAEEVVAIHRLTDGSLWVSTYRDGLFRVGEGGLTRLSASNGLPADGIWAMVEDRLGGVWMSSDFGIARVELDRLHAVSDSIAGDLPGAHDLEPMRFGEAEGMPSRESNRASPGGWRLTDGTIVFNSMSGLAIIDPEFATRPLIPPMASVQQVLADGVPAGVPTDQPLEVALGTRHLTFEFAALSFAAPSQRRYRYRLDGFDRDWIAGGGTPRVTYTGLGPGRYMFRVQGASSRTEWGEEARSAVVLPGYFWQSWWFRIGAILTALATLALIYRARVAHLLEMERFRLRIASDLHDDVGSNLSSISLLTEMLQARTELGGRERRQLERIGAAAGETIESLREIIWLVDPKHERLPDLVRRMQHLTGQLPESFSTSFTVHDALPDLAPDIDWMRNVLFAFKEALNNIVKHSGASRVEIDVWFDADRLSIDVRDDGVGYDPDAIQRGRGRANMKRRMEQAGGDLRVTGSPGAGVTVRMRASVR